MALSAVQTHLFWVACHDARLIPIRYKSFTLKTRSSLGGQDMPFSTTYVCHICMWTEHLQSFFLMF